MSKIAIIGAGGWGTALAIALTRAARANQIFLWGHSPDVVAGLREGRRNDIYLPGFPLPQSVSGTGSIEEALSGTDIILGAMPAAHARQAYAAMKPHLRPDAVFVSGTKGLERASHARISEIIAHELGPKRRIAVLSGPSFALEVARGDPTAVVLASADAALAADIQERFSGPTFRLYTNDDVVGTEIAGAVKNVIAIAAGVCVGLDLGMNTVAAVVTRGLTEMTRLAVALGGRRDTLGGLAGVGDLVLTSTGSLSRNRAVGIELGKGRAISDILGATRMVAEGVGSTEAALILAQRAGIEMPITGQVLAVLTARRSPRDAIRELMDRRLTQE